MRFIFFLLLKKIRSVTHLPEAARQLFISATAFSVFNFIYFSEPGNPMPGYWHFYMPFSFFFTHKKRLNEIN